MGYVLPVLVQLVLDFEARRAFVPRHAAQLNDADRTRWLGWVPARPPASGGRVTQAGGRQLLPARACSLTLLAWLPGCRLPP